MSHVDYRLHGAVAVIRFGNPPVNSLAHAVRRELADAFDRAAADAAVKAVVLTGTNGVFSGGADIREFGLPAARAAPNLLQLIAIVDEMRKPVVAAIGGTCLGGGFELALSCHFRVAAAQAPLGLPESKLGLLPGAGGTQRLPRLVGMETALNMILSGEPVPAKLLAKTALLDKVVEGDPVEAAIELAADAAAKGETPRRVRDIRLKEPNAQALCQVARNTVKAKFPQFPALIRCIDAVEAAAKPFDEGSALERSYFVELMETTQSKALRHVFFAERAAARVPDVPPETPTREIRKAAVIGGGTMGSGIAICFLNAGIPVTLLEADQKALDAGLGRIRDFYDGRIKRGKMQPADRDKVLALLSSTLSYGDLKDADIVIEAVFEEMSVKETVFRELDRVMKPGAILATNTSTLDVNKIGRFTKRPQDVIGTHFFSPANVMRLLEVVRGEATAKDVLATTMKLAKTLKKTPVVAGVCDGFIGNRMLHEYVRQAGYLLEAGASPQQIDGAIEAFGFAMGPFRVGDLAGNDVGWRIRKRKAAENPGWKYSTLGDRLCEMGRYGQKTQAGWYDYKPGDRTAYPSKVVDELIAKHRAELGIVPREISPREIVDRLVFALVNEGAKILEEKIAQRASDIDVVYLTGYGFPVWRGGPMFYADTVSLYDVVRRLKQFAADPIGDPDAWKPAPLLARLAAEGGSFKSFDEGTV
ncbi:MAG TPA: 3-hydroxyacyl-CoA dehydrogenase NAD-binding domain-containing protein [Steroidobacteraceae bacterium]|nr:3-hydroxyacyl-CoA dehydrogenase NAD-binding domain-containing protein [Steroidobacteraceae bacterium]